MLSHPLCEPTCAATTNSLLSVVVFFRTLYFSRTDSPMFDFIESCLRHKSEMVIYEAAHAIVNMKHTTAKELAPAVSVLQLFCSSPKPTLRFAAVRTLNKVNVLNYICILLYLFIYLNFLCAVVNFLLILKVRKFRRHLRFGTNTVYHRWP